MCYLCSCFGWALDFLQRLLTLCLSCCICVVVCTSMLIAITAGIAYGYNYSMAESLTLTQGNRTVYMRSVVRNFDLQDDADGRKWPVTKNKELGMREYDKGLPIKTLNTKSFMDAWNKLKNSENYANIDLLPSLEAKFPEVTEQVYAKSENTTVIVYNTQQSPTTIQLMTTKNPFQRIIVLSSNPRSPVQVQYNPEYSEDDDDDVVYKPV